MPRMEATVTLCNDFKEYGRGGFEWARFALRYLRDGRTNIHEDSVL